MSTATPSPVTHSLAAFLAAHAAADPEGVAYWVEGKPLTWRAFEERTRRVATGLAQLGIGAGDEVVLGIPESALIARDVLTDEKKKQTLDLLTASSLVGRPYIVPRDVPADRLAALRTAFNATMKDDAFNAEIAKQRLTVAPMDAGEVAAFLKELYKTPADVITAARILSGD